MTLWLHLTHDEVQRDIPYGIVCETMEGAYWNTGRRKRLFREMFSESERKKAYELKSQAHRWYLTKGVPDDGVKMSKETYLFWHKLADFCAMI